MKKGFIWRVGLTIFILVLSLYFLSPDIINLLDKNNDKHSSLEKFLPEKGVNLGLDLKGGVYLTLGVDVQNAIKNNLLQVGQNVFKLASDKGIIISKPLLEERLVNHYSLELILAKNEDSQTFRKLVSDNFPQIEVIEEKPLPNGHYQIYLSMTEAELNSLEDRIIDSVIKTISTRIDQFGVAEPDIRKHGDNQIVVQLPGMDDTERAISIIGKTAHLEFRLVRPNVDPRNIPNDVELLPYQESQPSDPNKARATPQFIPVEKIVQLTGDKIVNASPELIEGKAAVAISFDKYGQAIFSELTGNNIRKQLAIILDGVVYSAPTINAKIIGGASITGISTWDEALDLALILRAGSLPAPIKILNEKTVGPSLGKESISQGVTAALIGGGCVIVFMAIYYGLSGVVAGLMVIFDVLLILSGMAMLGATLTLPGIAGIVLTLGMAVDANVLIFERIREELANGKSVSQSVEMGFSRAMMAIFDSNLTTIFAAIILYQFGTGPIRGFAVTLTLGIIASMFTAIFVSRVIFDWWLRKPQLKLSI